MSTQIFREGEIPEREAGADRSVASASVTVAKKLVNDPDRSPGRVNGRDPAICRCSAEANSVLEEPFGATHQAVEGHGAFHVGEIVVLDGPNPVLGLNDVEPGTEAVAGREAKVAVDAHPASAGLEFEDGDDPAGAPGGHGLSAIEGADLGIGGVERAEHETRNARAVHEQSGTRPEAFAFEAGSHANAVELDVGTDIGEAVGHKVGGESLIESGGAG